ncbi:PREDICTED: uncharacterized protein LOC108790241 [Nanorana parkeri]|uniref:uncharacterized protein LOC108790241 n=1 Tax=Nanorana parkeri TaxID=125878 RepID=UPI0008548060|nr:PREDICTED: uncharacterized protein LOC108790241 [Nanorana parkeri]
MSEMPIIMVGVAAIHTYRQRRLIPRRIWVMNWLRMCDRYSHVALLQELRENNPEDFRSYLRMSDDAYSTLLALDAVLEDLKFTTGISPQAMSLIIPETCAAIIKVRQDEYMKFPTEPSDWTNIAQQFKDMWNFPNCGGAIDGKHVRITPPANSGSMFFNYKGYFSIILLAVVNASYESIYVDVGRNGRHSDGGVMEHTEFNQRLRNGTLNLPSKGTLLPLAIIC